ncbi:hypothetical protein A5678_04440 [Mycobacterium sp. E2733]|nr:hypothetical protein A5678_04440 [Mycobacterium sp. E2733]
MSALSTFPSGSAGSCLRGTPDVGGLLVGHRLGGRYSGCRRCCRFVGGYACCVGPIGTAYGGPRPVIERVWRRHELRVHDVGPGGLGEGVGEWLTATDQLLKRFMSRTACVGEVDAHLLPRRKWLGRKFKGVLGSQASAVECIANRMQRDGIRYITTERQA